jgi:Mor family transcriptional regulator
MRKTSNEVEKKVIKDYENGKTMMEISKKYKMGRMTITRILKDNSIDITRKVVRGKERIAIANDVKQGMSIGELRKKYNRSKYLIVDVMNETRVPHSHEERKQSNRERNEPIYTNVINDWERGMSRRQLSEKYNINIDKITDIIVQKNNKRQNDDKNVETDK